MKLERFAVAIFTSIIVSLTIATNLAAQIYLQNNYEIPEWVKKNNIYSWGILPAEVINKTYPTVVGGRISQVPWEEQNMINEIKFLHSLGIKANPGLSPVNIDIDMWTENPELKDATYKDINGEIVDSGYPAGLYYWSCTNNPIWQNYMKNGMFKAIDSGADGILVDEIYGNGYCLCDYCMSGFRDYLKNIFTQEELLAKFDISNIDSFNYRQYIIEKGLKELWFNDQGNVPLIFEFEDFGERAIVKLWKDIVPEIKSYALNQYGKVISFSANINDLNPGGLKFVDELDIFMLEYFYKEKGYPPFGKASPTLKLAHSFDDKMAVLLMAGTTNGDLLKRKKTSNLMKIFIGEAYSTQGNFMIPFSMGAFDEDLQIPNGSYTADISAVSPYYSFIINHPSFYENLIPFADVGLIYNYDQDWSKYSFYGSAYALSDLNIQYEIIFTSPGKFIQKPLTKEKLDRYKIVILPKSVRLLESDFNVLLNYISNGGKIIGFGDLELIDSSRQYVFNGTLESFKTQGYHSYGEGIFFYSDVDLGQKYWAERSYNSALLLSNPVDSFISNRVLTTAYSNKYNIYGYINSSTSDIVMHMINYDYDISTDDFTSKDSIKISVSIPNASEYVNAFIASPDLSLLTKAPVTVLGNSLTFNVPKLNIYNVAYLSKRLSSGQISISNAFPLNDTTIVSGEPFSLTIQCENTSDFPIFYSWITNNELDTTANTNIYPIKRDRSYEGTDTIKVIIANGFQTLENVWIIHFKKYNYPKIIFDEVHSPHFSPDSLRAIQLLINDEGPNFNPGHINMVWCNKLFKHLQKDFITEIDTLAPLSPDNSLHDVLFMVPCYKDISAQEREAIRNFVADGGSMLILSTAFWSDAVKNTNSNIYKLLDYFGFKRNPYLLLADDQNQNTWNSGFYVNIKGNHPATASSRINCNLGHKLEVTTDFAQIIETTGDLQIIEDLNGNNMKDSNEPIQSEVGIIGVSEYGKGRVVYITWHMFANDSEYEPNYDLVSNAMKWLTEKVNQIPTNIENSLSSIPTFFELKQNYPNPFNPTTKIEFMLPKSSKVEIKIYNMLGQEIKTLVDREFEPGNHVVVWDGTDNFERSVSSGVYFYRMKAGDFIKVSKGLFLK